MSEPERFELTFANLKAWCVRNDYDHQANEELEQIALIYRLMDKLTPLMLIPQPGIVVFAMRQPYQIPPDRVAAVLQATNRLNALSFLGAWSVNEESRELFFRVAAIVDSIHYTDSSVLALAQAAVGNSEKAMSTLHAIAIENADVETALAALIH